MAAGYVPCPVQIPIEVMVPIFPRAGENVPGQRTASGNLDDEVAQYHALTAGWLGR